MLTREEAQQVLDALANAAWCVQRNNLPPDEGHDWDKELELLRARLAQPEPEPVAWMMLENKLVPIHTAPPQREWQGLTDEEVGMLTVFDGLHHVEVLLLAEFIRAIEAKLKEKNAADA
jgi:hypothetical protein